MKNSTRKENPQKKLLLDAFELTKICGGEGNYVDPPKIKVP